MLRAQVLPQIAHTRHPLPAVWAVVRVLPVVHNTVVPVHVAESCKPHATCVTGVPPLPCVGQQVSLESILAGEALLALRAREPGNVWRVHESPVPPQVTSLRVPLPADLTFMEHLFQQVRLWAAFRLLGLLRVQRAQWGCISGVGPLMPGNINAQITGVSA